MRGDGVRIIRPFGQGGAFAALALVAVATGFYAFWEVPLTNTVRRHLLSPHMNWMVLELFIVTALSAWAIVDKPFPRAGRSHRGFRNGIQ